MVEFLILEIQNSDTVSKKTETWSLIIPVKELQMQTKVYHNSVIIIANKCAS